MQAGTLLLDGRPLFLRGANIQGLNALWFWGERDRLLDVLLLLKAADFNAVRSCQHVAFPEVRELQDRLGIMSQQDVGSRYPALGEQTRSGLLAASAALAHGCYNNPGVVLLSLANETHFDPTDMLRAVLALDPDRIVKPISGDPNGGAVEPRPGGTTYRLTDDLWSHTLEDPAEQVALAQGREHIDPGHRLGGAIGLLLGQAGCAAAGDDGAADVGVVAGTLHQRT